ncbi:MAG: 16S rRNA (uracil(1498)-N(3))-methyltransferase [Bacteroidaceae bacterium]|nr:16S rRNA (uracil(1498)-N(3))-methyltransferase [Bacteroidaceae bacterium]
MKEQHFFYQPEPDSLRLPDEEAVHAMRVLRLQAGDAIQLMDGQGVFYDAIITEASNHHCRYRIVQATEQQPEWQGRIHIAVAPTKNLDRMEWLAEKVTEIGFDRMSLLECRFSERRNVKTERLERIVVAAMKQSHKAWKPIIEPMQSFESFVCREDLPQMRFIAHCYEQVDVDGGDSDKIFLHNILQTSGKPSDALVMIGPEGDFSIDEVRMAQQHGFRSVSLGTSRLRTETAALVAAHLMRLAAEQ